MKVLRGIWIVLGIAYSSINSLAQATSAPSQKDHHQFYIPSEVSTTNEIHVYIVEVLTRALELTESSYGSFELHAQRESTVQTRQLLNLEKGIADIIWMISNAERDARARPIPVPVIGGLYGYRVLMVKKTDARFSKTLSLDSLRNLVLTQGPDWPDTLILEDNHFSVSRNPYRAGFRAVRNGYADAYPRALHEATLELQSDVTENLKIESHHLLFYPNPLFFYVNKTNTKLAKRIEAGMKQLVDSGELQQLLKQTRFYQQAEDAFAQRTVYELKNTGLSDIAKQAIDKYLKQEAPLEYAGKESTVTSKSD
ncbi:amino acid ABC transporter substrate-binding protein [Salinimonas sp. HHU 13199]|uniref:Amino acid ABC transporter substrate-binding protein n=1 Tax=Salinimonas profundi TaxID=2729140 RepID=A0ABR8LQ58_9ALTE|nr:transporter substrate-binding domain-containing protein [Salinimonas profundi]MBD3587445.1 amino acid ABC transporter substrate-binding protein [Salinimonas profundi]